MSSSDENYSAHSEVAFIRQKRSALQLIWGAVQGAPVSALFGMVVIFAYLIVAVFAADCPYGEAGNF